MRRIKQDISTLPTSQQIYALWRFLLWQTAVKECKCHQKQHCSVSSILCLVHLWWLYSPAWGVSDAFTLLQKWWELETGGCITKDLLTLTKQIIKRIWNPMYAVKFQIEIIRCRKVSQKIPPLKKLTHEWPLPLGTHPDLHPREEHSCLPKLLLHGYSSSWFSSMDTSPPGSLPSADSQRSCRHLSLARHPFSRLFGNILLTAFLWFSVAVANPLVLLVYFLSFAWELWGENWHCWPQQSWHPWTLLHLNIYFRLLTSIVLQCQRSLNAKCGNGA